jgi:hypothetical protein
MAELADAADSKSAEVHPSWGFNSPSRHQKFQFIFNGLAGSFFSRTHYVPRLERIERSLRFLRRNNADCELMSKYVIKTRGSWVEAER